jgi:hypothetical protein
MLPMQQPPAPPQNAPVHPADLPAPPPAPPTAPPAPTAFHDYCPSPPALRRSSRQRFEPRPFWISNAPLVPIPHDPSPPPASSALPAPAHSDQDSYHQDSDDEQGAEIAHEVWSSVLEAAGIYPEYVEMELDDAQELAFLAAHHMPARDRCTHGEWHWATC